MESKKVLSILLVTFAIFVLLAVNVFGVFIAFVFGSLPFLDSITQSVVEWIGDTLAVVSMWVLYLINSGGN